jgi:molecular chaperone GrpE
MKHNKEEQKKVVEKPEEVENVVGAGAEAAAGENNSEKDTEVPVELSEIDAAKKQIEELQSKIEQMNDTYLRTLAEYDNYRKRTIKEKADLIKTGGESVLINILGVVDDVERGLESSRKAQDLDALREGVELIYNKFNGFLKQNGISSIETVGEPFNTDHHEAIATIPAPEESMKGKVIDCVQKGYYLHDKVIRFAKVVVGE